MLRSRMYSTDAISRQEYAQGRGLGVIGQDDPNIRVLLQCPSMLKVSGCAVLIAGQLPEEYR